MFRLSRKKEDTREKTSFSLKINVLLDKKKTDVFLKTTTKEESCKKLSKVGYQHENTCLKKSSLIMFVFWTILILIFIVVIVKYLAKAEDGKKPPGPFAFPIIGKKVILFLLFCVIIIIYIYI